MQVRRQVQFRHFWCGQLHVEGRKLVVPEREFSTRIVVYRGSHGTVDPADTYVQIVDGHCRFERMGQKSSAVASCPNTAGAALLGRILKDLRIEQAIDKPIFVDQVQQGVLRLLAVCHPMPTCFEFQGRALLVVELLELTVLRQDAARQLADRFLAEVEILEKVDAGQLGISRALLIQIGRLCQIRFLLSRRLIYDCSVCHAVLRIFQQLRIVS